MHHLTKKTLFAGGAVAAVLLLTASDCEGSSSQDQEAKRRQAGYDQLSANQPADSMSYSPTRETINRWIDTWDKKGALAYVYVQNGAGQYGYYVLDGPPVSYCAMLTPNYEIHDDDSTSADEVVPAPGMDGAYYSGQQCDVYYGFDATTGAYVEFSLGANQSYFLFNQPQTMGPYSDATQLGETSVDEAKGGGGN
ncbi:hypothetical protein [Streptomonospora litoralis]|uniref:Uncharacterized protein n=1 Tax=Streptomonospora litoralis TaxID=2498135 RepID=A0A4P6Q2K5_9ACTN|nr:hypothetical protein [Streptomonospora litoralis]QBI53471.1 hypothetical protein EKD16_08385 [Streptomonospora litoralis]